MKFTKRVTSLLLIFVFAFASMCTYVQAADFTDVTEADSHYDAISSLVSSGVINGYEDGTFKPDNTITRAEFSKLLAVSSAPTGYVFSATTTNFSDIKDMNADHGWAVPYISYAVSTGAINGYTDGTFQAGNPVTYGEAVKMIVCTLGYGPVVDTTLTPWYQGYLSISQQIGLNKNAVSLGDNPASRGIVAQLIYNMLDCPVLTQTGTDMNGNPIYSTEGSTGFGDSKDNATSGEGIVMGVTDYSLDASAVGRNRVQIDNTLYSLGSGIDMETVKSYIGYRVSYSYTDTSSVPELIKLSRLGGYNSEVTLEPWQISDVSTSGIEYYVDEAAERKDDATKVSFASPLYVVYNGYPVDPGDVDAAFISQYFDVDAGSIKLFNNDGNDKSAEVVFIESYETYFVNSPAISNGVATIYDKNSTITGLGAMTIDEDDTTSITKVSSKGGKPTTAAITAIANKSVVSVAVPYGITEGTKVVISTAYVTGDVNELSSDYKTIKIGTGNYELSPYYETLLASDPTTYGFVTGDNAKFYLDYLGRIVFMEKNESSDPYGLLIAYAEGGTLGSTNYLKIMSTAGKVTDYAMKSEIKVDGDSKTAADAITYLKSKCPTYDASKAQVIIQPVIYKLSGSTVTAITTLTAAVPKQSLSYSSSGYSFKDGSATKFSMLTSGSNATEVFVVPVAVDAYDKYSNKSAGYFSNTMSYTVAAYEMEGANAKIVVCYLIEGQTVGATVYGATSVYIVEGVSDAQNSEGQLVKKLTYRAIASADESKEVYSNDDSEIINKLATLSAGDLIKFVTEDGAISQIKTVFTGGALTTETGSVKNSNPNHITHAYDSKSDYYQAIYGTIYDYNDEAKQISIIPSIYSSTALDETSYIPLTLGSSVQYYKYDTSNPSRPQLVVTSLGEVKKYIDFKDTDPTLATKAVFVVMNDKVVGVYFVN